MKLFLIFFINITLIFLNSVLIANERNGVGLAIEGGSFKPVYNSARENLETSKSYGFSIDYQWDISESMSFYAIGVEHGGKSTSPPKQSFEYYKSGFLGGGIKAWIGSFFIGGHFGEYYLTWIEKISSYTTIMQAGGNGFGFGFETKSGIIIATYREKSRTLHSDDMRKHKVIGDRILLGFRWK